MMSKRCSRRRRITHDHCEARPPPNMQMPGCVRPICYPVARGLEQFGRSPILPDIDLSALSNASQGPTALCNENRNASLPMRLSGLRAFRNAHCLGPGLRPTRTGPFFKVSSKLVTRYAAGHHFELAGLGS
jgi:hypothetical protein